MVMIYHVAFLFSGYEQLQQSNRVNKSCRTPEICFRWKPAGVFDLHSACSSLLVWKHYALITSLPLCFSFGNS